MRWRATAKTLEEAMDEVERHTVLCRWNEGWSEGGLQPSLSRDSATNDHANGRANGHSNGHSLVDVATDGESG